LEERYILSKTTKFAIVTGGTQGIGYAITEEFLQNGFIVITCARNPPKTSLFTHYAPNFHFIRCDMAKLEDRKNFLTEIMKMTNRIDVLVNNAGIAPNQRKDILEATEESFEQLMKVNLQGPYFLTQQIAKLMVESKVNRQIDDYFPCIINISSISAFTSSTSRGEYCISKAGVHMMTELYADRLAEFNIPVFEIQPGIIETPMTIPVKEKYDKMINEGVFPLKRWGQPEDVAKTTYTLATGNIPYSTGQVIHIDGGFHLRRL